MPETPIYDRNIALEWYQYGLERKDDFFMRFMMHWIAFNWLYSSEDGPSEREKIRSYYEKNLNRFDKYDPFSSADIDIFERSPVLDGKTAMPNDRDYDGVKRENAKSLLMSIYQVRCNLFHGSKSLRIDRDRELVRASANILEGYLKVLLKDK